MRSIVTAALLSFGLSVSLSANAQSVQAVAQSARVQPAGAQSSAARLQLSHHVPDYAAATSPLPSTVLAPSTQLHGLVLVLSRAPQVEAALTQFLADQQNPSSPNYHHWLTPVQLGELYGPAQSDLDAVTSWLTLSGLTVASVSPSRTQINFSGSVQTLSSVFSTSFRTFSLANGESRFSLTQEPSVPANLFPVIKTISGLSQVIHHSNLLHGGLIQGSTNQRSGSVDRPQVTATDGSHYLLSSDYNLAFDINAANSAGYTGSGQKIAVIGQSRVNPADVANLEALTGQAVTSFNTIIPPAGVDPGPAETTGTSSNADDEDQDEATIDINRSAGTASGATIDLVVSADVGQGNTYATSGLFIAINYEINTLNDPIMNISFGGCEALDGQSNSTYEDGIFQTAAAEGISTFVSSGDSGAAACNAFSKTIPATQQLSINDLCGSSYVTCVGGTEFADTANPAAYWNATNNSTNHSSIISYIPEGAWNEVNSTTSGTTTTYNYGSTGGGLSVYIDRPSWQVGTGLLTSNFREVPDVALPASGHDGFVTCLAYQGAPCSDGNFAVFGGTSVAAPSMAGIQAIANQKLGDRQGQVGPTIYRLAADPTYNVFHDTTVATSAVAGCSLATPSMCNNSTPSENSLSGGLQGYLLTTGWDAVTGWGSIDVNNLLTALDAATTTGTLTADPTTITTAQTVVFTDTVTSTTAGTLNGSVQFTSNGTNIGSPVPVTNGTASTSLISFPTAGTYNILATYNGDTAFAAALSFVVTAPTLPLTTTTVTGTASTITVEQTVGFTAAVSANTTTSSIVSKATPAPTPTGTVQFVRTSGGSGATNIGTPVTLTAGQATLPPSAFPAGTFSIYGVYSGDSNFTGSTSAGLSLTVNAAPTTIAFTAPPPATVAYTATIPLSATVSGLSATVPTTASVVFKDGTTTIGTYTPTTSGATIIATATVGPLSVGTHNITATFLGDTNYASSTTPVAVITVTGPGTVTLTPVSASLTITAGSSGTDVVNVVSAGFVGTQTLNCAVNFNGPGTANDVPTCAFNPTTVTFTANGPVTLPSTITISSVAASAIKSGPVARNRTFTLTTLGGVTLASLLLIVMPRRTRGAIKSIRLLASVLFLAATFLTLSGCGGGGSTPTPPIVVPGTTAGSYDITINSNSDLGGTNNVGYSGTIALTIQ